MLRVTPVGIQFISIVAVELLGNQQTAVRRDVQHLPTRRRLVSKSKYLVYDPHAYRLAALRQVKTGVDAQL